MTEQGGELTLLLKQCNDGDKDAESRLITLVYRELRRLAGHYMRHERAGHTLQPTALVHEAYVRLMGQESAKWHDRKHFFSAASRVMRNVLVDHARSHRAAKRGGEFQQVTLDGEIPMSETGWSEVLAVHEALDKLAAEDPRKARIVELRYFTGLSVEETADLLSVSAKTVKRDWSLARIWLHQEIAGRPQ